MDFFILFAEGVPDHFSTHEGQQQKSHPVIIAGDMIRHRSARRPADQRHEKLKETEAQRQAQDRSRRQFPGGSADADRDGKGIHAQTDGNDQNRK